MRHSASNEIAVLISGHAELVNICKLGVLQLVDRSQLDLLFELGFVCYTVRPLSDPLALLCNHVKDNKAAFTILKTAEINEVKSFSTL